MPKNSRNSKMPSDPSTPKTRNESAIDFPGKLRLIMRVTGCDTQKALLGKLRSVNPSTVYDPARAYKWIQGRAQPRSPAVYDDLALLLDVGMDGEQLRSCDYKSFHALLAQHYGHRVPDWDGRSEETEPDARPIEADRGMPAYLPGTYLALSRAWSPHRPDALVLGMLVLGKTSDGCVSADYLEQLPWNRVQLSGPVQRAGRNLNAPLSSEDGEIVITFTLTVPPAPGALLAGVMSGVTINDAEMRPIASRIVCLRLPDETVLLEKISRYLGLDPVELSERLQAAGFTAAHATELAAEILGFLLDDGDRGLIGAPSAAINSMIGKVLIDP